MHTRVQDDRDGFRTGTGTVLCVPQPQKGLTQLAVTWRASLGLCPQVLCKALAGPGLMPLSSLLPNTKEPH